MKTHLKTYCTSWGIPCALLLLFLATSAQAVTIEPEHGRQKYQNDFSDPLNPTIDWENFLANSDIRWGTNDALLNFPDSRNSSAWIGNGLVGCLVYKTSDAPWTLGWQLGRMDVTTELPLTHSFDRFRAHIGWLNMTCNSTVTNATMRYHILEAELRATIQTTAGDIAIRSFIDRDLDLLVINAEATGSAAYDFTLNEQIALTTTQTNDYYAGLMDANETPRNPYRTSTNGITVAVAGLSDLGHGAHAVAYKQQNSGNNKTIYLSIGKYWNPAISDQQTLDQAAIDEAVGNVSTALQQGFSTIVNRHHTWWDAYLKQAYVEFPNDPRAEQYYWINIARFASLVKGESSILLDNNGPFMMDSAWAGTWWNMNVQVEYYPAFTGNRMDVGYNLVNAYTAWSSNNWWQSKHYPESFIVGRHTTYRSDPNKADSYEPGNLTWALHNLWRYWKFSMDPNIVTGDHGLFEILKKNVNYFRNVMGSFDATGTNFVAGVKGPSGKWHLPINKSPEYWYLDGNGQLVDYFTDANYSLQLFKWALDTLVDLNDEFNMNDPLRQTWVDISNDLLPFPIDGTNGLAIAKGVTITKPSRHHSHIIALHPLHTINPDQGQAQEDLMRQSLNHWLSFYKEGKADDFRAYSFVEASCMWATLGEAEKAYRYLMYIFDEPEIEPNGWYFELYPVQESPLGTIESFNYMLLQSWGDCIRVFPATPDHWPTLTFTDLRTEGAFLISAHREKKQTRWIRIKSLAGQPCLLQTDLNMNQVQVTSSLGRTINITPQTGPRGQARYAIDIQKDETVLITSTIPMPQNHAPTDIQLDGRTLMATANPGTTIGRLTTIDADDGETFAYELLDNLDKLFDVRNDRLVTAAPLSLNGGTYAVKIRSTDLEGLSTTKTFYITSQAQPSTSFRPTDISGCLLWLDALDPDGDGVARGKGETVMSGPKLTQWNDKSGNQNHAIPTQAYMQPSVIMEDDLGGLTVVRCDGDDDTLLFNRLDNVQSLVFVLRDAQPVPTNQAPVISHHHRQPSETNLPNNSDHDITRGKTSILDYASASSIQNQPAYLNHQQINAKSTNLPVDQYCQLTLIANQANLRLDKISGDRGIKGRNWLGDYCEIILYNKGLSSSERTQLWNYLENKWLKTADNPNLDNDGDGLPNGWEQQYTGSKTGMDSAADSDGDGFSNWEEWLADTDPLDITSFTSGMTATFLPGSQTFKFGSSTARRYQIMYTTNLVSSGQIDWKPLNTPKIQGSGNISTIVGSQTNSTGFYRLNVTTP